ncbi:hypothetical protein E2C01_031244 [Portunus trituberculatus]|uniref:Uncharacterized protein n=1 Tax=Portunus trituberculatus TaxID=210409 RepID=A0A5B7EWC9_PORTR|nr:hypothetical protein [Portunus trituberculatus]
MPSTKRRRGSSSAGLSSEVIHGSIVLKAQKKIKATFTLKKPGVREERVVPLGEKEAGRAGRKMFYAFFLTM